MPDAGYRHHREFQAFTDLHGHQLDLVAGGVKVVGADAVLYRQLALRQGAGAQHGLARQIFPVLGRRAAVF